ncbi:hypothetical protein ACSRUE_06050 [Sorangium sp. KYC3313]|uniref:hypothetical protein n=1 Tax=Sorangium sp. KYC3313 TaxID=3449740 RepID=UPI003F8C6F56
MKRAVASHSLVVLAAIIAAIQPGCHRERKCQGDASPGELGSSTTTTTSAPAASASPAGSASTAGAGPVDLDLDAARPGITGSSSPGAPPPSTAGAGAASPAPGLNTNPSAPGNKPFDQDAWLAARGAVWRPDASCWSTLDTTIPPQRLNMCSCHGALSLPEVELIECSRAREQDSTAVPFVTHTVLYAARGGAIRAVENQAALPPQEGVGAPQKTALYIALHRVPPLAGNSV